MNIILEKTKQQKANGSQMECECWSEDSQRQQWAIKTQCCVQGHPGVVLNLSASFLSNLVQSLLHEAALIKKIFPQKNSTNNTSSKSIDNISAATQGSCIFPTVRAADVSDARWSNSPSEPNAACSRDIQRDGGTSRPFRQEPPSDVAVSR